MVPGTNSGPAPLLGGSGLQRQQSSEEKSRTSSRRRRPWSKEGRRWAKRLTPRQRQQKRLEEPCRVGETGQKCSWARFHRNASDFSPLEGSTDEANYPGDWGSADYDIEYSEDLAKFPQLESESGPGLQESFRTGSIGARFQPGLSDTKDRLSAPSDTSAEATSPPMETLMGAVMGTLTVILMVLLLIFLMRRQHSKSLPPENHFSDAPEVAVVIQFPSSPFAPPLVPPPAPPAMPPPPPPLGPPSNPPPAPPSNLPPPPPAELPQEEAKPSIPSWLQEIQNNRMFNRDIEDPMDVSNEDIYNIPVDALSRAGWRSGVSVTVTTNRKLTHP